MEPDNILESTRPFVQVPQWSDSEDFKLNGRDFRVLYDLTMWLSPLFEAVQRTYMKGQQDGTINITYQYQDGSGEVPEEVWKAYFETAQSKINELKAQYEQKQSNTEPAAPEQAIDPVKSSIITQI